MLQEILLLIVVLFLFYKILGEENYLVDFFDNKTIFFEKVKEKYNDFMDNMWLQQRMDGKGIKT